MAGAGYKLFATGDVLTAAQVNTYLMQQTVMVFASSAARTTALSGVLAEGMVSYLQDTNTLEVYDGSAWVGATGDITGLTAGTGISISSATGPVPTVTNSMATEITAKGDLIVGTGSGTFDNLAAGSNGDTIVADSSQTTGLAWAGNYAAGKNKIINGAFDVWQRGSSFTLSSNTRTYCADRFAVTSVFSAGSSSVSRQTFTPATAPVAGYEGQYFQRITAATTSTYIDCFQFIEDVRTFAGQSVTFSFWAKASASVTINGYRIQNFGSGGSSEVAGVQGTFGLTTSWQRFTTTFTVPSISGKTVGTSSFLGIGFYISSGITAGLTIDTWGVQLEAGSVATAFNTATGTIQGELAACQRYYFRTTGQAAASNDFAPAFLKSTTEGTCVMRFPVPMRTAATGGFSAVGDFELVWSAGTSTISNANIDRISSESVNLRVITTGLTTGQGGYVAIKSGSTKYFEASAEL
jgi:hypothetical protein